MAMKIRRDDTVRIIKGKDRGKTGRVLRVDPRNDKVFVEGANIIKRHQKANPGMNRGGGIIDKEAYIDISNVQMIDPDTGKPTRVRYQTEGDGSKVRVAARSKQSLEK